jgi:uncharacterized protein involved in exopolysaccharide biosynthesis
MAKKKSEATRRKRRSPEEMIADLQKQITDLKARAEARQLKQSAAIKATLAAVKAIDKGIDAAKAEDNTQLHHVLADAREPLAAHLTGLGMTLPKPRRPKGRRPK